LTETKQEKVVKPEDKNNETIEVWEETIKEIDKE
jgi:hypothetical protein